MSSVVNRSLSGNKLCASHGKKANLMFRSKIEERNTYIQEITFLNLERNQEFSDKFVLKFSYI